MKISFLYTLAACLLTATCVLQAATQTTDLIVYGGTPAGVIVAVAASREGASVIMIEPTRWIGGMVTED